MAPRRRAPRPWYRTRAYRLTRTIVLTVVLVASVANWAADEEPVGPTRADLAGAQRGARDAGASRAPAPRYYAPPRSTQAPTARPKTQTPRRTPPDATTAPGVPPRAASASGGRPPASPSPASPSRGAASRGAASAKPAKPAKPASPTAGRSAKPRGTARPRTLPHSPAKTLAIPYLGIKAPVMGLRLDPEGRLPAPPDDKPNLVGWYSAGPAPGGPGTAVVVGHRDTRTGPAVFAALEMVKRGRVVEVRRADGRTAVYTVHAVKTYEKARFPDELVYGTRNRPELRLITCGGAYDRRKGYASNVVVFAHLTEVRGPARRG